MVFTMDGISLKHIDTIRTRIAWLFIMIHTETHTHTHTYIYSDKDWEVSSNPQVVCRCGSKLMSC